MMAKQLKKEELNVEFAGTEIVFSSQETAPEAEPDRSPKKAKLALRSRQSIDLSLPIDSDPEVAAKQILVEAESKGLERAREAHEILRRSLGANLDLAGRISESKPEELLRIERARFQGNLSAISGGRVNLILDLSFAANPVQTVQMDFDFKDPMAGARHLAGMLLPISS